MDVVELAKKLIEIESTTTREGKIAKFLSDEFERSGFLVKKQGIEGGDPEMEEPRTNVLALSEEIQVPRLVFSTHIDTVPPFIPLSETETHLYGRGSCDAKGVLAAQWLAVLELKKRGHQGLGFLAVVGEETNSIGAKRAKELLPKAEWIIDGEPTDMVLTSAAKGIFSFRVRMRGVAGHSAYPERGVSAVHALLPGLTKLIETRLPSRPEFGETTVNVGRVEGGVAANVIAPDSEALVIIRLAAPVADIQKDVERLLGKDAEIEMLSFSEPRKIYVPEGMEGRPVSFGSDVPYLSEIGTTLLVGPGSIHDAHTEGEKISKKELREAVEFYIALGEKLLAGKSA